MKFFRLLTILFSLSICANASAAEEDILRIIGNQNLKGTIKVGEQSQNVSGGVSLLLAAKRDEIQSGKITIGDLNIRYNAVNQRLAQ